MRSFTFEDSHSTDCVGISPIAAAREAIGLAQAAEEHAARFFSNNAEPGGILSPSENPRRRGEEGASKSPGKRCIQAPKRASRGCIGGGNDLGAVGVSNKDSQFLENRKFQVIEIARMFDLPPHKLMEMSGATFSNIEHQSMEFVTEAISPRAVRWEQAIERDCMLSSDAGRFVVRFTSTS
jgi:HK97 family phage portal protein